MAFENLEIWWVTGAQLLYGGDAVVKVDAHSKEMVEGLNASGRLPIKVVYKGTANSSKEVLDVMRAANTDARCAGIITWMHTFSPAKMWIHGLQELRKPLLHLHTQYNAQIPWDEIDMDFMNLNQSAHGDREFGHICARMGVRRKVVVGYWKDQATQDKIAVWERVAAAWADSQDMVILRFGDQMNNVAVTDGDKVAAEMQFGYHVDYCPVSTLMEFHKAVKDEDVKTLYDEYLSLYDYDPAITVEGTPEHKSVMNAARAELALRACLKHYNAKGFTTNFDDLGTADINDPKFEGFDQIPGLASQRLMAEGYGFGAEGDWKSAALYRSLWVMSQGKGCSFLEDYTLNFDGANSAILQAHMLEICPLIASAKPRPSGVHLQARRRRHGHRHRHGQQIPPHRQRRRVHRAQEDAQAPRGLGTLDTHARLRDRRWRMDHGRRHAPQLLLVRDRRSLLGGLRRDGRHRDGAHQQGHHDAELQARPPHQRRLLHAQ